MYICIHYTRSPQARFLHFHLCPSPLFAWAVGALHFTVPLRLSLRVRSRFPACQVGRRASLPQDPRAPPFPCIPGPQLSRWWEVLPHRHLDSALPAVSHSRLMGLLGAGEQAGSGTFLEMPEARGHRRVGRAPALGWGGGRKGGGSSWLLLHTQGQLVASWELPGQVGISISIQFAGRTETAWKKALFGPADISVHL